LVLAIVTSSLSAGAFFLAFFFGLRVGGEGAECGHPHERTAGLFAALAVLLLVIAAVFWLRWLFVEQLADGFWEAFSDDERH
jgi:hypothetical protein